jgi:hypothetical protein
MRNSKADNAINYPRSTRHPKPQKYTKTKHLMTNEAQNVKFRQQMKKLEVSRLTPAKVKMLPREKIRINRRCKLCASLGSAASVFATWLAMG